MCTGRFRRGGLDKAAPPLTCTFLERTTGFEPATPTLARLCSTTEPRPRCPYVSATSRRRERSSPAGVAEPSVAPGGVRQLVDDGESGLLDGHDHQLGHPVAAADDVVGGRVGVDQGDPELAPIAGVHQSGRVDHSDPVADGQPAAGQDEAGVTVGNGHGHARPDDGPPPACGEDDVVPGDKVGASIAGPGVHRQRQRGVEADEREVEHRPASLRSPTMLAWIDLEMTGLDADRDVILEIAALVTDDDLNLVADGPDLVVHQPVEALDGMDKVVTKMHRVSGLSEAVGASSTTLEEAGAAVLEFLRQHVPEARTVPLCGNSIATDRRFLARHLPDLEDYFHYRSIDVSTVKELCRRWYPEAFAGAPEKTGDHRALGDIRESIAELRHYRETIFRPRA